MYHYNKSRNINSSSRQTVTPKESQIFGPHLGLHASGSAVSDRSTYKQNSSDVRSRESSLISSEVAGNNQLIRKYGTSSDHHQQQQQQQVPNHIPAVSDKLGNVPYRHRANNKLKSVSTAIAHDLTDYIVDTLGEDNASYIRRQSAPSMLIPLKSSKAPPVQIPGDRVIFAESPSAPGIPIVYRTPDERNANPDRLNLDRRRLSVCPILEGEDQLRLLNYQHNLIIKIQHLNSLKKLIFLDLYDNQIEEIGGLNYLRSLRVLMLGKNKIRKIENLDALIKLDVLDLHGNRIKHIENLNHLLELRVLNLAGNEISHGDNLNGMDALAELNLRRNKITTVTDVENLPNLQRLFLSFNEITSFEDISCLSESNSLTEISLDGNPFCQEQFYKQTVLRQLPRLKQLDMKRVTEEERRVAAVMARKEEEKKKETNKAALLKEKRKLAINNAKRQWEVAQTTLQKTKRKMPDLYANHVATVPNTQQQQQQQQRPGSATGAVTADLELKSFRSSADSRPVTGSSNNTTLIDSRPGTGSNSTSSADKEPIVLSKLSLTSTTAGSLSHLAELDGDTLNLYGIGSLDALDRNWGIQAAAAINTVAFKFIDFDEIVQHLHKIRARFPSVHTLIFSATNIQNLHQINALACVRRLDCLTIELEGNPVAQFNLWKIYTIYRLAHFSLRKLNDEEVTAGDVLNAERLFGPVGQITTSKLTQNRLQLLVGENRRMKYEEMKGRKSPEVKSGTESVSRAGLNYQCTETAKNKRQEMLCRMDYAKLYIRDISLDAIEVDKKRSVLRNIWPDLILELISTAVIEMYDQKTCMKKLFEELEKS
ncbi:leucine-rich repeat-containing protein 49-like [Tubulanus polymorphus]|uniref:leucine-rich repeat-containing protein 49-like n=1 Tax=Tubulanus polymorphus TaxID=672921 RepID=UPI003DA602CA